MIKRLIKPSKKYNLTFRKHVVSLQPKAISNIERNKSPPLAEAILPQDQDGRSPQVPVLNKLFVPASLLIGFTFGLIFKLY